MLAVIDTHLHRAEAWAADAGVTIDPSGYMLTEDPTGKSPMAPDTLTHRFSRLTARTGVGSIRFHDIRHSVATTLLGAGYDLAVVAGRLGHRDPTVHASRLCPCFAAARSPSCDHSGSAVGSVGLGGIRERIVDGLIVKSHADSSACDAFVPFAGPVAADEH